MALQKTPFLTEKTVDLVIAQIKANFNLALAELDNQYTDGINLEPVDDNAYEISDQIQPLTMPSVFVLAGPMQFNYNDKPNYLDSEDEMTVVVSCEDIGADVLARKAFRYARVLYGCLNLVDLKDADGRILIKTVPRRLGYTQPIKDKLTKEQGKFRMDCVLELRILHFENNLTT